MFKHQIQPVIRRLVNEKRLVFLNGAMLKYTDRDGTTKEQSFDDMAQFMATKLFMATTSNKAIQVKGKELNADVDGAIAGLVDSDVILEVLREEYNKGGSK